MKISNSVINIKCFLPWDQKTDGEDENYLFNETGRQHYLSLLHCCRSSYYNVNHISSPAINTISFADSFPWKLWLCLFVFDVVLCVDCAVYGGMVWCAGRQCWDQTRVPGRWVVFILLIFRGSRSPPSPPGFSPRTPLQTQRKINFC